MIQTYQNQNWSGEMETDGYIMGSRMIVREQPSIETIKYVNNMFAEQARRIERKAKESGKTIEEYINMQGECLFE